MFVFLDCLGLYEPNQRSNIDIKFTGMMNVSISNYKKCVHPEDLYADSCLKV